MMELGGSRRLRRNICALAAAWLAGGAAWAAGAGERLEAESKHTTIPPVHQWIANEGWRYFSAQIGGADIEPYIGQVQDRYDDSFNIFLAGAWAADENDKPPLNESDFPLGPFVNHFCAGADGAEFTTGWDGHRSNIEQARLIWPYVLAAYIEEHDKGRAYFCLGQLAHLVQDLCVPAHVHNDPHPPFDPDQYEAGISLSGNYRLWYYGSPRSGEWSLPLTLFESMDSLFRSTADYTEDYDSTSKDGDGPPYYTPGDFPERWHRPDLVDRNDQGAITIAEVGIAGDDLMPYAIKRTAELIRFFYSKADATSPQVEMQYPASADELMPDLRSSNAPFRLRTAAMDAESGVVREGFQFYWSAWEGGAWGPWQAVTPAPGPGSTVFTPAAPGLYRFRASAENGGGLRAESPITYIQTEAAGGEGEGEPGESLNAEALRTLLFIRFGDVDTDENGSLDVQEINEFLQDRGIAPLDQASLENLDASGDQQLSLEEVSQRIFAVGGCDLIPGCGSGGWKDAGDFLFAAAAGAFLLRRRQPWRP